MQDISKLLLVVNIFISIMHPIKYIPQIIHTLNTKKADDLSKKNILCELVINILTLSSSVLAYYHIGEQAFLLPVVIEKASSTVFICYIYHLKTIYTYAYTYEEIKPVQLTETKTVNV
tara:strand:- start:1544 stop:1897 length:354 start_codon:yes stop_codon:yes gene_type:complete